MKVWCVRHRSGWCAIKNGQRAADDAVNVKTKCRHVVVFHFGCEVRVPTCPECLASMRPNKKATL